MPPRPHPTLAKEVGVLIRHHRERQKLSQSDLAVRSGLSVEFIGRVERGHASASLNTLAAISSALETPVRDLFGVDTYVAAGANDAMARVVGRLASLPPADLEWADRLLVTALSRKPGR